MNRASLRAEALMPQSGRAIILIPASKYQCVDSAMFIPNEWQPEIFIFNFTF
jgi:hypothetical protein